MYVHTFYFMLIKSISIVTYLYTSKYIHVKAIKIDLKSLELTLIFCYIF